MWSSFHRRGSVLNGSACATGFNPHCHFILLLQSICFDHSILLDFLISSETCFLEYLVHYLKYLKEDWQGFTATCGGPGYCSPMQLSATGFCALKHANLPDADGLGSCIQPLCGDPPVGGSVSAVGHRLVAYDSSDESESESEAEAEASTAMNQEADGGFASITQKEKSAASLTEADSTSEGVPEGSSTHKHGASAFRREVCHPVEGPVLCLSELREVLTRLQRKKLFPYNPSSLLKLLAQVLNCYQHSETSQWPSSVHDCFCSSWFTLLYISGSHSRKVLSGLSRSACCICSEMFMSGWESCHHHHRCSDIRTVLGDRFGLFGLVLLIPLFASSWRWTFYWHWVADRCSI